MADARREELDAFLAAHPEIQNFDLLFDIDSAGTAQLIPAGLLGFQAEPAWRRTNQEFSAITSAPTEDYTNDQELVLAVGDVFFGRSRNTQFPARTNGDTIRVWPLGYRIGILMAMTIRHRT